MLKMTNCTTADLDNLLVARLNEIVILSADCLAGVITSCVTNFLLLMAVLVILLSFAMTFLINPIGLICGTIIFGFSRNLTAAVICYFGFGFLLHMLKKEIDLRRTEQNTPLQNPVSVTA